MDDDSVIQPKRPCLDYNADVIVEHKRPLLDEINGDVETCNTLTEEFEFTAPDSESPLNILNSLNDHCLQEVFKRISIVDLSCAAEVCKRFQRNAEEIFLLCYAKRFRFVSLTLVKSQILRNFVHLIKSVYLNGSQANRCLSGFNENSMIQSLHLRSARVNVETMRLLLGKLTSLELSSTQFADNPADLLSFCSKLQYLKVKLSPFGQFSPCQIPKLQKFEYDNYEYTDHLLSFIELNPQLASISVTTLNKVQTPTNFQQHLLRFGNFKSLTSLKIPCFQSDVTPLIESIRANNIRIQQLQLIDCRIIEPATAFQHLFQIKGIKNLAITGIEALSIEYFIGLAKKLPELKILRLETQHNSRSTVTISDVKQFVRHSKNLHLLTVGIVKQITVDLDSYNHLLGLLAKDSRKTLTITFIYVNSMAISVPKETLRKHKGKIRIVGIKYDNYMDYMYGDGNTSDPDDDDSDSDDDDEVVNDDDDDNDDESNHSNASDDESATSSDEDSDESSNFASILGSADESDDNLHDSWLDDVYKNR